mmetsp:Transcript_906/g.2977  ORF Transcript_906/g.2977 Transcript_906/m.2977 type:complete len:339 (-) Transcript_906:328-1344(-)
MTCSAWPNSAWSSCISASRALVDSELSARACSSSRASPSPGPCSLDVSASRLASAARSCARRPRLERARATARTLSPGMPRRSAAAASAPRQPSASAALASETAVRAWSSALPSTLSARDCALPSSTRCTSRASSAVPTSRRQRCASAASRLEYHCSLPNSAWCRAAARSCARSAMKRRLSASSARVRHRKVAARLSQSTTRPSLSRTHRSSLPRCLWRVASCCTNSSASWCHSLRPGRAGAAISPRASSQQSALLKAAAISPEIAPALRWKPRSSPCRRVAPRQSESSAQASALSCACRTCSLTELEADLISPSTSSMESSAWAGSSNSARIASPCS